MSRRNQTGNPLPGIKGDTLISPMRALYWIRSRVWEVIFVAHPFNSERFELGICIIRAPAAIEMLVILGQAAKAPYNKGLREISAILII